MGCCDDVLLSDQHAPALVLGEQSQPRGFPHQHLPRPFAESRARSADDSTVLPHQRPHSAHCKTHGKLIFQNSENNNPRITRIPTFGRSEFSFDWEHFFFFCIYTSKEHFFFLPKRTLTVSAHLFKYILVGFKYISWIEQIERDSPRI